ncbi:Unknown protein sequence [Pseudomonas syringae pv. aceris]|nr:Unknown protein sequence [Pseudomonas syringae pv. aceris]
MTMTMTGIMTMSTIIMTMSTIITACSPMIAPCRQGNSLFSSSLSAFFLDE